MSNRAEHGSFKLNYYLHVQTSRRDSSLRSHTSLPLGASYLRWLNLHVIFHSPILPLLLNRRIDAISYAVSDGDREVPPIE